MAETKQCQNCKQNFQIEPEDFKFYEKVSVPPPTWCPECRLIRRMTFRNERTLYKRNCNAPGHSEEMISLFSPDKNFPIYDHKSWWGDDWNPLDYGREFDFAKPFFESMKQLWHQVPDISILNINPVNSDYCSITEGNKNCYLVVGGDFNEDVSYSGVCFNCKDCIDTYWISKCELNYETIDCINCRKLFFSRFCDDCYDSAFIFNCKNCHDCFGCTNLMNKSYQIFNMQHSKEDYFAKLAEMQLGSHKRIIEDREKARSESLKYPRKFARMIRSVNSTGDNLEGVKNCRLAFDVFEGAEDSAYIWLAYSRVKDSFDSDHFGKSPELVYEVTSSYPGNKVFFSRFIFDCHDMYYSYNCHGSNNLFGCIGLRNKSHCILNKQYTKEEYEELVPKIIKHMNDMPYTDAKGRIYKYGEFFPPELSPFSYNETIAQEYFPLTKEEALAKGYAWKEPETRNYQINIKAQDLPDHINDVKDDILNQIVGCVHEGGCNENCTEAFRIIPQELNFLRKQNLPIPRLCPNCRHYQRIKQRNPLKLWKRQCQCAGSKSENQVYTNTIAHEHGEKHCENNFETTYAPERSEIIYCEKCYLKEVV